MPCHMPRMLRLTFAPALLLLVGLTIAGCSATSGGIESGTGTPVTNRTATPASTASAGSATPAPHAVNNFTCDAGSLPVPANIVRRSCLVALQNGQRVLLASYLSSGGVDEQRLASAGWLELSQAHGDSPVSGASGWAIWVDQSAWFYYEYGAQLNIVEGIPDNPQVAITCGQTVSAGGASPMGLLLPAGAVELSNVSLGLDIAPACGTDVQHFYETTVPAQTGCKLDAPFALTPGPGTPTASGPVYMSATCSLGGTTYYISLASMPGTPTFVSIDRRP